MSAQLVPLAARSGSPSDLAGTSRAETRGWPARELSGSRRYLLVAVRLQEPDEESLCWPSAELSFFSQDGRDREAEAAAAPMHSIPAWGREEHISW